MDFHRRDAKVNGEEQKYGSPKEKKARMNWHQASLSGLDGWLKAHAVWVRTGEFNVPRCWTQKIASVNGRDRFINTTRR